MRPRVLAILPMLLLVHPAAPSYGQQATPSKHLTLEQYLDWEAVADPQIAPDASRIVYTRRWVNKLEDRYESALWLMNADGSKTRFLVKGSSARWSPDGTRVAYLAEGEPKGTQIWIRWMDAEGATSQITRLTESPGNIAWAPDGRSLAFTMLVPEKKSWDIGMPAPPPGAKWTENARVVDRLVYKADYTGYLPEGHTHIFVVSADGGTPRQITSGAFNHGAPNWTPDGRTIVFSGLREPDYEYRYLESHLYAVNAQTGDVRQITSRKGPWGGPVVSPDGRLIAFTGFEWTPQTYKVRELYVVGLDGTGMRQLSGTLDRDPGNLRWAPDGSGVYFTAGDRGSANVYVAPVQGQAAVRKVTDGVHMLSLNSLANDLTAVGIRSAPHEPGDVVRYSLRRPQDIAELTHVNDDVLEGIRLGDVEEVWYTSTAGTRVQGWIVKPPGFDRSKKYPMILDIHGGPHAMYNVAFNYYYQAFAAAGYVVLYTNPRGSTGYGTEFGNAINDAYPSVDHDDLMAGVDTLVGRGYVDPKNLFVEGCSGGGVLTSWVIGHTDRFAAAGVLCPVVNWMSFAGTTDIVLWGYHRYKNALPWENPELWLKHSPITYVGNVKTPTLILTGEKDLRTPMGQTEEYYQALKLRKVPTVMVRIQDEWHAPWISRPTNFLRTWAYVLKWFEKYRTGATAAGAGSP